MKSRNLLNLTCCVFLLPLAPAWSQAEKPAKIYGLTKGHIILEAYYGAPNFGLINAHIFKFALKPIIEENVPRLDSTVDVSLSGIGPLGGRAEYMLSKRWGLGIDFIYNSTTAKFTINDFNIDSTYFGKIQIGYTMTRIRPHFRANFHFCNKPRWDVYLGAGIGLNNRIHRFSASVEILQFWDFSKAFSFSYPYSARACIGFRGYPFKSVGLGMELGLGGPLISGGISVRFNPKKKLKSSSIE